jgi:hypothetical protein
VHDRPRTAEHGARAIDAQSLVAEDAYFAQAVDAGVDGIRVVVAAVREHRRYAQALLGGYFYWLS